MAKGKRFFIRTYNKETDTYNGFLIRESTAQAVVDKVCEKLSENEHISDVFKEVDNWKEKR